MPRSIRSQQSEVYYSRPDAYGAHEVSDPLHHEPVDFNLDDYAGLGFTYRSKPIFDLDQVVGQIDSGSTLSISGNNRITYTFLNDTHLRGLYNNPNYGFTAGFGASPFSAAQQAEARQSIQFWDDLIAPTFVESNGMGADIVLANSADPGQAYAYYPGSNGWKFHSDVFVADPELNWTNNWLGFNGYGATTLIHELGHAIGLSHPGAYNGAAATTYAGQAEYAQDSEQYSIMSYWAPAETGARIIDWSTMLFGNAQTPMLHDIYVIQQKYGADPTTRVGNTTYGFNSNAGRDVFDFSLNGAPNVAIYDAGGIDTLDFSGFNASTFIDLHAGSFSSAAQAAPSIDVINGNRAALQELSGQTFAPVTQASVNATLNSYQTVIANAIAADTGVTGVRANAYDNIAIAYGTTIENAIGGSQRDVLWGNEVANRLEGRGGDDVLNGYEGADTLVGGAGADRFQFSHAETGDRITDFVSGTDRIDLSAFAGTLSFVGAASFSGANQVRYVNGVLSADFNGDGVVDFAVTLGAGTALLAGDLML